VAPDGGLELAEAGPRVGDVRRDAVLRLGQLAALAGEERALDAVVPGEDTEDADRSLRLEDLRRDVAQELDGARRERRRLLV
jgi:hypothetical protein